jgi:hypothetical protein
VLQAIDSETMLIMPGGLAPAPVCFTYAHRDKVGIEVAEHAYPLLDRALEEHHTTWANAPFDLGVMGQRWPTLIPKIFKALDEGRIHDVQSREKLLDIAKGRYRWHEDEETGEVKPVGYSIDQIAKRRKVGKKTYDKWRLHYYRLHGLPLDGWPEEAKIYALVDAIITLEVHKHQDAEIGQPKAHALRDTIAVEADAVRGHWALHLISAWGFPTHGPSVESLYERCVKERDKLLPDLRKAGLVREDGTRDISRAKAMVLQAYTGKALDKIKEVFAQGDRPSALDLLDEVPITATGQERMKGIGKKGEAITPISRRDAIIEEGYIATSRDVCKESGDPVLEKYARYSQLANLLGKDIPHLRRGTVIPIQTGYQPIMETFRTSSTGFNIQNLRREPGVRECFRARDGHVIVACDFDTAELVSLAQVTYRLFGASTMRDVINAGLDIHLRVAAELTHCDYETAAVRKEKEDPEIDLARQLAKALDFGLPGGMGPRRFVGYAAGYLRKYGHTLTEADAALLKKQWMGWFPEMPAYFDWIASHADGDGWFHVKHPITGRWRGKMFYTAACNNGFQELTAFGAKAAAYAVAREQHCNEHSPLFGTKTLAFVHDELLLEMPEDRYLTKRCAELKRVMCDAYNVYTPDVPVSADATAMRVWSKKAKTKYDANGNILIWEPKAA